VQHVGRIRLSDAPTSSNHYCETGRGTHREQKGFSECGKAERKFLVEESTGWARHTELDARINPQSSLRTSREKGFRFPRDADTGSICTLSGDEAPSVKDSPPDSAQPDH
jgi:hypothetical protein